MPNKNPFFVDDLRLRNDVTEQPTVNGQIKYVSGTGFRAYAEGSAFTIPTSSGAATAYDDIGDPDASGSISFGAYTGTYTSSTANWGGLILKNSHANPTAGASLLNLQYNANGDADGVFISCKDNAYTDAQFTVGGDGSTTIAGTAAGTDALTLTAGDITLTDGHIELTTGHVAINSDNVNLTLGASGATDSKIYFDGAGNLTFYDSTAGTLTLTQLYSGIGTDPTLTGNVTFTDGTFTWTSGDDEQGGTWTFSNTTSNDIAWSSQATTGNCLSLTANALTSGSMVYLESSAAGMVGEYIRCYDGAADDFVVGANGAVTITGSAAGTDAFTITTGDILLNDSDQNIIESEDGTTTTLLIDNKAGVIADNNAVLTLDAGGAMASGSNILRLAPTGSPNAGAIGLEFVGASKAMTAVSIDADPTASDVVEINGGGALTNGLAVLAVTNDGNLAAGGCDVLITMGGTPNADARALELDAQKDAIAIYADSDAATDSAYQLLHPSANLAAGKSVLKVQDGGTPAADNVYVGHFQFSGTATAESSILFADGGGKDVTGLLIDVDPVYAADNYAGHLTMYSDAAGDLPVFMSMIKEDAGAGSGEYCSKIFFYGADDAAARELYGSIEVEQDDVSAANPDGIIWIKGDLAGTNTVSAGFTGNKILVGAAASTITSAGAWDLTLSTNDSAAGEPSIALTDGNTGDITITAGTTSGEVVVASPLVTNLTTTAGGGDGAITVYSSIVEMTSDGDGTALTLADGVEGQIMTLTMVTDGGGDVVVTPANLAGGDTTLTFTDVGESAILQFTNSTWIILGTHPDVAVA